MMLLQPSEARVYADIKAVWGSFFSTHEQGYEVKGKYMQYVL